MNSNLEIGMLKVGLMDLTKLAGFFLALLFFQQNQGIHLSKIS